MVDKVWQAFAWARAVPVLWAGTAAVLTMGLGYGLALGVLHGIEHAMRRLKPGLAAVALRRVRPRPTNHSPS